MPVPLEERGLAAVRAGGRRQNSRRSASRPWELPACPGGSVPCPGDSRRHVGKAGCLYRRHSGVALAVPRSDEPEIAVALTGNTSWGQVLCPQGERAARDVPVETSARSRHRGAPGTGCGLPRNGVRASLLQCVPAKHGAGASAAACATARAASRPSSLCAPCRAAVDRLCVQPAALPVCPSCPRPQAPAAGGADCGVTSGGRPLPLRHRPGCGASLLPGDGLRPEDVAAGW